MILSALLDADSVNDSYVCTGQYPVILRKRSDGLNHANVHNNQSHLSIQAVKLCHLVQHGLELAERLFSEGRLALLYTTALIA